MQMARSPGLARRVRDLPQKGKNKWPGKVRGQLGMALSSKSQGQGEDRWMRRMRRMRGQWGVEKLCRPCRWGRRAQGRFEGIWKG